MADATPPRTPLRPLPQPLHMARPTDADLRAHRPWSPFSATSLDSLTERTHWPIPFSRPSSPPPREMGSPHLDLARTQLEMAKTQLAREQTQLALESTRLAQLEAQQAIDQARLAASAYSTGLPVMSSRSNSPTPSEAAL